MASVNTIKNDKSINNDLETFPESNLNHSKTSKTFSLKKIEEIYEILYRESFPTILIEGKSIFLKQIETKAQKIFLANCTKNYLSNLKLKIDVQKTKEKIEDLYSREYTLLDTKYKYYKSNPNKIIYFTHFKKHCPNTSDDAYHYCSPNIIGKFIEVKSNLTDDNNKEKNTLYVICLKCKKCYKSDIIRMFCDYCKKQYFSSPLSPNEDENIFPATWEKYHCNSLINKIMKCIKCQQNLYINIKTNKLICLNKNCNFSAKAESITWKCNICSAEFKSPAKIYNPLEFFNLNTAIKLTLLYKKKALPPSLPCCPDVDMNQLTFYHKEECKGILYLGELNEKEIVVCEKCHAMNFYKKFTWICPRCKKVVKLDKYLGSSFIKKNKSKIKEIEVNKLKAKKSPRIIHNRNYVILREVNSLGESSSTNNNSSNNKDKITVLNINKINKNLIPNTISINNFNKSAVVQDGNIYDRNKIIEINQQNYLNLNNFNINNKPSFFNSQIPKPRKIRRSPHQTLKEFLLNKKNKNNNFPTNLKYSHVSPEQLTSYYAKKIDSRKQLSKQFYWNNNESTSENLVEESDDKKLYKSKFVNNLVSQNSAFNFENVSKRIKYNPFKNIMRMYNSQNISNDNSNQIININNKNDNNNNEILIHFGKNSEKNIHQGINTNFHPKISRTNNSETNIFSNKLNRIYKKNENKKKNLNNNLSSEREENSNFNRYKRCRINSISSNDLLSNIDYDKSNVSKNINNNDKNNSKDFFINKNNNQINNIIQNVIEEQTNKNNNKKQRNQINISNNQNNNINELNINMNISIHVVNDVKEQKQIYEEGDENINKLKKEIKIPYFNDKDYTFLKSIGEGTFGIIYSVRNNKTKQEYALKKILCKNFRELKINIKEFELMYSLKHENIVKVYNLQFKVLDFSTYSIYVLMEKAKNDWNIEIKRRIMSKRFYKEEEIIFLLKQIVKGLSFLQRNKIAHRDIKPQNILIFSNKVYKIADFGEANKIKQISDVGTIRGSELYMSPIVYTGHKIHQKNIVHNPYKSDVFSLGYCLIYAMTLSLQLLESIREATDMKKVISQINKILVNKRKYSEKMVKLIIKMVDINEDKRYDFIELEEELKNNYN